jgi:hypothetical protein
MRLVELAPGVVNPHVTGHATVETCRKEVFSIEGYLPSTPNLLVDAGRHAFSCQKEFVNKLVVLGLLPHRCHLLSFGNVVVTDGSVLLP